MTNSHSHFNITQASVIAALTFIVGQVVAFVPSLAKYQAELISAGTIIIPAIFLIVNAVHKFADSKKPPVAPVPAHV